MESSNKACGWKPNGLSKFETLIVHLMFNFDVGLGKREGLNKFDLNTIISKLVLGRNYPPPPPLSLRIFGSFLKSPKPGFGDGREWGTSEVA
jgi:hypothetical protein